MLDSLIAPTSTSEFLERYLSKEPLYVQTPAPGRFDALLSAEDIERLLAFHGRPHQGGVRLAKFGAAPQTIHAATDQPLAVDELLNLYREGYTLNVNDVADRHEGVRAMVRGLVQTFAAKVTANLFVSPAKARAFPLHFDTHDVLVLQLSGRKRWRVFAPAVEAPLAALTQRREIAPQDVEAPLIDQVLQPGDALYVPRGFIHEVNTESCPSRHLSIGLHLPTCFDLLMNLLRAEAERNVSLRRALPHRALLRPASESVEEELKRALHAALEPPRPKVSLERMLANLLDDQPPLEMARFTELTELTEEPEAPKLDTQLEHRPGLFAYATSDGVRAHFLFQRGRLSAPLSTRPALEFVASTQRFFVRELPELSDRGRLLLANRLVQLGALRSMT